MVNVASSCVGVFGWLHGTSELGSAGAPQNTCCGPNYYDYVAYHQQRFTLSATKLHTATKTTAVQRWWSCKWSCSPDARWGLSSRVSGETKRSLLSLVAQGLAGCSQQDQLLPAGAAPPNPAFAIVWTSLET